MKILKGIVILGTLIVFFSCATDDTEKSNEQINQEETDQTGNENIEPPFFGSIFEAPDIITDSDPTTFIDLSYAGRGARTMFDRRVNDWVMLSPFLFNASYDDGLSIEIQVNPEFASADIAEIEARKYGEVIGKIPTVLRKDVETVWIHKGLKLYGGGNNNILIHTEQTVLYEEDGILEETLIHEASHTSLDRENALSSGWKAAQKADNNFMTDYARDNPEREDVAESFLFYMAIRYRSDRISDSLEKIILETMPNRISYFDNQELEMYPIVKK